MIHTISRPHRSAQHAGPGRREQLSGIAAIAGLLVLLAGVPYGLGRLLGSPLPDQLPTAADARNWLTAPLDDHALLTVLAAAAWLAWLHLAGSILLEARRQLHARQLRGTTRPAAIAHSPGGRGLFTVNRQLAQQLVAAALMLLPATSMLLPTAQAAAITRAAVSQQAHGIAPGALAPTTADVGVPFGLRPGLGEASTARAGDAIARTAAESPPRSATEHREAADGLKLYVVAPPHGRHYDSLWDIADRHLGDGRRYREIYDLNHGRPQPDGKTLSRASLIRPGWELLLPADATGGDLRPARPAPTTSIPPARTDHTTTSAPAARPEAAQPSSDRADQIDDDNALEAALPNVNPAATNPAAMDPAAPAAAPGSAQVDRPSSAPPELRVPVALPLGLGIGALGVLAALQRARRIAHRRRPAGSRPSPVPASLVRVEAGLRREAKAAAGVADTVRLACALAGTSAGNRLPIRSVIAHDGGAVELQFATGRNPRLPAPFVSVPGGWQLPAASAGYTFGADELGDPLPALLPVGRVEDAEHFHDLGHDGLVALTGPDTEISSFLATAAASLAGAPWAGQLQVLTPPDIAAQIGAVEHLESVTDLPAIVPHLLAVSGPHGGAASPPLPTADDSRQIFVLVGWRAAEIPPLLTAAALDPHRPVIALVRGPHPDITGTWQLTGHQLLRPGQTPTTVMLPTAAAACVPALLEHARTASPVPADDEQYEGLRRQAPPQPPPSDASNEDAADGIAPGSVGSDITVDGHAEPPDKEAGPIQIRILGPVDVHGAPPPRRNPVLQILIYLAVHRRGVDAGQIATALWPDAAAAGQTLRNRIAEARSIVGGHITAGPRWQLTEQIGCDWQHFQALAVGDDSQQRAALDLVRGRPFEDMADTEWIHLEGLVTEMEAAIVDLALIVAARALNGGEPAAAFAAARAGLRASPYEERLYRLAMRAADAEGASGKIRTVMRELRTVLDSDIEPDDTIERETVDLYQQLMDSQTRGASPVGD